MSAVSFHVDLDVSDIVQCTQCSVPSVMMTAGYVPVSHRNGNSYWSLGGQTMTMIAWVTIGPKRISFCPLLLPFFGLVPSSSGSLDTVPGSFCQDGVVYINSYLP